MDPYEIYIDQLLMARMEEAKRIVKEKKKESPPTTHEHLPFEVNKTMNYIKQDAFLRQRKKLKNVSQEQ